jgi:hypothetical protein
VLHVLGTSAAAAASEVGLAGNPAYQQGLTQQLIAFAFCWYAARSLLHGRWYIPETHDLCIVLLV